MSKRRRTREQSHRHVILHSFTYRHSFHIFFNQLDNFSTAFFLWVTAHGFDGSYERKDREQVPRALADQLGEDDDENPNEGEG